jgi:hypothetical protein
VPLSNPGVALLAFSVVFLGMTLIALLLYGLRALGRARPERAARGATAGGTEGAGVPGELDPELIAVLAAAAEEALGARARIHRVHIHGEAAAQSWSRAGRLDVLASHRVAPKRTS